MAKELNIPIIKYGERRYVQFDQPFVLDGTQSYSRYYPRDKQHLLKFEWSVKKSTKKKSTLPKVTTKGKEGKDEKTKEKSKSKRKKSRKPKRQIKLSDSTWNG